MNNHHHQAGNPVWSLGFGLECRLHSKMSRTLQISFWCIVDRNSWSIVSSGIETRSFHCLQGVMGCMKPGRTWEQRYHSSKGWISWGIMQEGSYNDHGWDQWLHNRCIAIVRVWCSKYAIGSAGSMTGELQFELQLNWHWQLSNSKFKSNQIQRPRPGLGTVRRGSMWNSGGLKIWLAGDREKN